MMKIGIVPAANRVLNNRALQFTAARSAAAFHTSPARKFDIPFLKQIPQPPGYIVGTVNDAYIPPHFDRMHGSLHWDVERLMAISLVPLTVIPFVTGSFTPALDGVLGSVVLVHSLIGFQSCIIDYIPKRVYGKQHDYAMYLLGLGSVLSFYGLYLIEKDIGLTGLLTKLWQKPAAPTTSVKSQTVEAVEPIVAAAGEAKEQTVKAAASATAIVADAAAATKEAVIDAVASDRSTESQDFASAESVSEAVDSATSAATK